MKGIHPFRRNVAINIHGYKINKKVTHQRLAVGLFIFNKCLAPFFTKLASGALSPSNSPEAAKKKIALGLRMSQESQPGIKPIEKYSNTKIIALCCSLVVTRNTAGELPRSKTNGLSST